MTGSPARCKMEAMSTQPTPTPGVTLSLAGRTALKLQKGEVWVINSADSTLAIVEHIRRAGRGSGPT